LGLFKLPALLSLEIATQPSVASDITPWLPSLVGFGLRRAELAAVQVEDVQQREEHCVFADLSRCRPRLGAPDSKAYKEAEAEKAWRRLLAL
jgi:hypothetical protein